METILSAHPSRILSSSRRSFLVGRPLYLNSGTGADRICNRSFSLASLLSSDSSYRRTASFAERRLSASPVTLTTDSYRPLRMRSSSPILTAFDFFGRRPLRWTFPPSTASLALRRVLKNRAAQSQRSSRTSFNGPSARRVVFVQGT